MNHQALGECIAYRQQASDAADRRFALLLSLSLILAAKAKRPELPLEADRLSRQLDAAIAADEEFITALDRANHVAPLCGQRVLEPGEFARPAVGVDEQAYFTQPD